MFVCGCGCVIGGHGRLCTGVDATYLLVAARSKHSDRLLLAACAKRKDVLQFTERDDEAHLANGVYWYCLRDHSFGFR